MELSKYADTSRCPTLPSKKIYKPKSVIRLLCANMLSFCHLSFRLSVTMEPHCALKT